MERSKADLQGELLSLRSKSLEEQKKRETQESLVRRLQKRVLLLTKVVCVCLCVRSTGGYCYVSVSVLKEVKRWFSEPTLTTVDFIIALTLVSIFAR